VADVGTSLHESPVVEWIDRLWGISAETQRAALDRVQEWAIPHLSAAFSADDADGILGAVLLVESFDAVVERGVEAQRLLAKLRRDPDVWPTWAEIRAAGLLARFSPPDMRLVAEPGRGEGRQPDFALVYEEGEPRPVEFKALGLSEDETAFSRRVAPLLPALIPRTQGLTTLHVQDIHSPLRIGRPERRRFRQAGERFGNRSLHPVARPIAASVIVGHGTEATYVRRLAARFAEALHQLPTEGESWVAFHWSNGAPSNMVRRALTDVVVPDNLAGIIMTGTVAVPGSMDNFVLILPRPFDLTEGETEWHTERVEHAQVVFARLEESSGLRPTLIRVPHQGRFIDFLHRNGNRRILPFNVLLEPDPPALIPPRDT
jgi:hypothetical protein